MTRAVTGYAIRRCQVLVGEAKGQEMLWRVRWDWIGEVLSCLSSLCTQFSGPCRTAEVFYQWRVLHIRKVTPAARMDGSYLAGDDADGRLRRKPR